MSSQISTLIDENEALKCDFSKDKLNSEKATMIYNKFKQLGVLDEVIQLKSKER